MSDASRGRARAIYRITFIGAAVNAALVAVKLAAGVFGRSSAMIADAVHSLSDFATDIVLVIFVKLASKPTDECHDFGHGKFETLSTVIMGVCLFGVGAAILRSAAGRIMFVVDGGQLDPPGYIALAAAAISVVCKEWLYVVTKRAGERLDSQSVIANAWDHRSDALSSIGTLIGVGGAIFLGSRWTVLDPIAAVVVSLLIMWVAVGLVRPGIDELLEKSLPKEMEDRIVALVERDPAVSDVHNLRTRRIGVGIAAEVHVRVDGAMSVEDSHELTRGMEERMREEFGEWARITVHVEPRV